MARYPYTQAMYQAGILPYALTGLEIAGLSLQEVPEAFLRGIDIARALEQEKWQKQQYEQQMKYTQGANLLNMVFDAVSRIGDIEQAKTMLTPDQKQLIRQTVGIDIDSFLASLPKIGHLFPEADFSIVGENVKNLGYWLGNLYTTLPGSAVKELLGEKFTTATGETIKIVPEKVYVLPSGYQQLWGRKQQLELNKKKLAAQLQMHRDKIGADDRLKAIKTVLDTASTHIKAGDIDMAKVYLKHVYEGLNKVFIDKVGVSLDIDPSVFETDDVNFLQSIINTISENLSIIKPKTQQTQQTQLRTPQAQQQKQITWGGRTYSVVYEDERNYYIEPTPGMRIAVPKK